MPTHNIPATDEGRSTADSIRAQDFAPHANARVRVITVTETPTRLNDLLGSPGGPGVGGDDAGPSKGVTKLRIFTKDEMFWFKRDPRDEMTSAQFREDGAYIGVGDGDAARYADVTWIVPDNPWLMMPIPGSEYGYGADVIAVVEEL